MVEYIEELGLYSELHPLAHRKRFREIEVIPDEIGATQGVAAEVSELATLWVVATGALPSTRINRGNKRGRIEPLEGARLRYTGDGMMLIEADARNDACELRSAALHNAVSIGRIGCAQNGERHPTVPEHGSGNLPAVEDVRQLVIPNVEGQLIHILRVEIVPDVIVARTVIAGQLSGQRRKNPSRRELKESSVRNRVHAAAPRVVELSLQTVPQALHRGELKAVVMTVLPGGELGHRAESWIGWLHVGEWRKAPLAYRLVSVHLGYIGLVHSACSHISRKQSRRGSELMFNSQAPLHEVLSMQSASGHRCDCDGWETRCGICLRGCAQKLSLRESRTKSLICGDSCIHCPVRHSRSDGSPDHSSQRTWVEGFVVRWIRADQVGHTARQNIAEDPETGSQRRFWLELPCDRCSRLQNGQRRGRKQIAEMSLDGGIQRLIHIMRDRAERTAQTRDLVVWIERIRIEGVAHAQCPGKLPRHFPGVLGI